MTDLYVAFVDNPYLPVEMPVFLEVGSNLKDMITAISCEADLAGHDDVVAICGEFDLTKVKPHERLEFTNGDGISYFIDYVHYLDADK